MLLPPAGSPEGDGVGVGALPPPDQEGAVPGNPHEHVLRFPAAQPVIVPPAAQGKGPSEGAPMEEEALGSDDAWNRAPESTMEITPWASPPKNAAEDSSFLKDHQDVGKTFL